MAFWRSITFWHRSGTILSLAVALVAVGFSGMQYYADRDRLLLSTRPHVDFETDDDPDEPPVGIAITNAGPGPAIIKSITFYVDKKPVRDADEAGTTYGGLSAAELDYMELEPDDTFAVGEKLWLIQYRKPRGGKVNQKNLEKFSDFVEQHLAIYATYCSAIREEVCWSKCSAKDRCK